jgi:hypothetical protein
MLLRRSILNVVVLAIFAAIAEATAVANADNVVLRWNEAAITAIQTTRIAPPIGARALAIVHTCMFEAWAAYDDTAVGTTRFAGTLRRPKSERTQANKAKAISFAAHRALLDLFPGQAMVNFDPLMSQLGFDASDLSDDLQVPAGIGNNACNAVLALRHHDGSNQLGDQHPGAYSDYTSFTPVNTAEVLRDPNRWQPLLINGVAQRWLLPQWGMVSPFASSISSPHFRNQSLAAAPFVYPSTDYWKQALEVVDLSAQLGD